MTVFMTKDVLTCKFEQIFGASNDPIRFFAAPGRVNLIGEHIDYCGGYVFPAALTLNTMLAIRPNNSSLLRMAATDLDGIYTADLNSLDDAASLEWGNYQAGTAKELIAAGFELTGMDMLYHSNIPFGAGLSSSASIELVTAIALTTLANNSAQMSIDPIQLALASQRAENNFCNVNCGIMDQFASAMGKKNHAMLLNCSTLEYKYVPLDLNYRGVEYVLVLANTCKKHALGASKYNERRAEVARGLDIMNELYASSGNNNQNNQNSKKSNLCDYTVDEFRAVESKFSDEIIKNRVEHVIFENARVKRAVDVLQRGDLPSFAEILCEANDSICNLYEVTGAELDAMFVAAMKHKACLGARMTGAGFGGCTVNIVRKDSVESFIEDTGAAYEELTKIAPQFYICSIGDGASEIF